MPSAKRERKRAGRAARLAAIESAKRRKKRTRQAIGAVIVILVALGVIYLVSRPTTKKAAEKATSTTHPTTTTTAPASTTTTAHAATTAKPLPCPPKGGSTKRVTSFPAPPPTCITPSGHYEAVFTTTAGSFTVSLDAAQSPVTVNAFVYLARYGFYDGTIFHRVLKGFVVQGGDPNPPTTADPNPTGAQGPGFEVNGEVPKSGKYAIGEVAMAKTSTAPNGATGSQFFIITGSAGAALPPDYALLGTVTKGMSVVDKIQAGGVSISSATGIPKITYTVQRVTIVG